MSTAIVPPLPLVEPHHAQRAARRVPDEDRDPDVDRIQRAGLLDHEADAERHDDLRDDRDVERALGVARALQPAGVGERDGDEQTRTRSARAAAATPISTTAGSFMPKIGEQLPREEQEEDAR